MQLGAGLSIGCRIFPKMDMIAMLSAYWVRYSCVSCGCVELLKLSFDEILSRMLIKKDTSKL